MNPHRSDHLRRHVGVFFVFISAAASLLVSGCLYPRPKHPPSFSLSEADVRQAGALALYSKGLLLESAEGSATNGAKKAAQTAFRQACRLDPDNRRPLAALLSSLADGERYGEALEEAEAFLTRHPEDVDIRLEAARFADAANRPADAACHCAAILDAQPDNRPLAVALVRLYFQAGQEAAAFRLIRKQHTRYNDKDSSALPVQWAVHFSREEKQPALALDCLSLAVDMRTNAAERAALITLAGENQLVLGNTNAASASFLQAYRENPAYNVPLLRLGAIWANEPDATNRLTRQVHQEKDPQTTLLILAATQQAMEDETAAAATLRDYYARRMRAGYFPDEGYYLWLGSILESQKAYEAAERLFIEASFVHPSSHEIKNFLAYMWAEKGVRLEEADRLSTETLRAEPENAAYLDTKGWILFKRGRVFDALQFLLRAADLEREEPVILDHVGDVLLAAGRESEAVAFWTRSHQCDPQPTVADKLRKHGVTPSPKP